MNPREVIPGAWRIELPLPWLLGTINIFLLRTDDGYLLIDCGMDTEACAAALDAAFLDLGVAWTDVRRILLTHVHPDHIGMAPRLLKLTGAELLMHADDLEFLHEMSDSGRRGARVQRTLALAGVPVEMRRDDASAVEIERNFHRLSPDRLLKCGDVFDTACGPLEVICTPGHSPGHVCLYASRHKALFSGDHMLERITPNINWHPGKDALGDFLDSLEKVAGIDIELVLPSHGSPFPGHREWIARTAGHHEDRCGKILEALRDGPKTAHELVADLWTRKLPPFHHRFAVYEVLAHLEYLRLRGRVRSEADAGGALWWSRAPAGE